MTAQGATASYKGLNVYSNFSRALSEKQLELLKVTAPRISRVTVLYNPVNHGLALNAASALLLLSGRDGAAGKQRPAWYPSGLGGLEAVEGLGVGVGDLVDGVGGEVALLDALAKLLGELVLDGGVAVAEVGADDEGVHGGVLEDVG